MTRAALICPGRGSYTEQSLGSLPAQHPWVVAADDMRRERDLEPLSALDGAGRFSAAKHLRPANVSALIYLVSMLDAAEARERYEVVCVGGNSMGWYTALAVAGALSFEDGFRLVQEMALLQEDGAAGGQVIYPVVDEHWQPAPDARERVRALCDAVAGDIFPSIHLGGYEVLAGTPTGVARLLKELPPLQIGKVRYPFQLALHGPYHTPLAGPVAERAKLSLANLGFRRPELTLIDGRGARFTPGCTDVTALADYTLGAQVDTPYDFTTSLRVALLEHAPDRIVLPGPGNSLGGVCAQVLIAERWRGVESRADFDRAQAGQAPLLDSLRR